MDFSPNEISRDVAVVARRSRPALRMGIYVGAALNLVMFTALVAANRFPGLDRYALERNAISYSLFVILMLLPVCGFYNRPVQMLASGMAAWTLFTAGYNLAGALFGHLFLVLRTPFQAFVEGIVVYGVVAAISWVIEMVLHARHHSIALRRSSADEIVSRRR
jgi:hypothetical protein